MTNLFREILEILKETWGFLIVVLWGMWEWKGRKGKAAKERVDTIEHLVKSVEDLSRKYDELLAANSDLHQQIVTLRNQLAEKDVLINSLRARITELEKKSDEK